MKTYPYWDKPTDAESRQGARAIWVVQEEGKEFRFHYDWTMLLRREMRDGDMPPFDWRSDWAIKQD